MNFEFVTFFSRIVRIRPMIWISPHNLLTIYKRVPNFLCIRSMHFSHYIRFVRCWDRDHPSHFCKYVGPNTKKPNKIADRHNMCLICFFHFRLTNWLFLTDHLLKFNSEKKTLKFRLKKVCSLSPPEVKFRNTPNFGHNSWLISTKI